MGSAGRGWSGRSPRRADRNSGLSLWISQRPRERFAKNFWPSSGRYKIGRNLLAGMKLPDARKPVVVLDNIGRLTRQRLSFLRDLNLENRFLFIAIAESFLSEHSLFLLRACLFPGETITLRHLSLRDARAYFQCFADKHGLSLTNKDLTVLAETSGGYPLGMRETAQRLVKRKEGEADRFSPDGGASSSVPHRKRTAPDGGSRK